MVLSVFWAIGALLASIGAWLVAITAQYAIGAFVAALVVSIEMLITGILTSTIFWVAASAYGIYTGYNRIKDTKNNPNLIRKDAAFEYGFGTAEIILSLLPFWGKFKRKTKENGGNSNSNKQPKNLDDDLAKQENPSSELKENGKFAKGKSVEEIVEINGKKYIKKIFSEDGKEVFIKVEKSRISYYHEVPGKGQPYGDFTFDGEYFNAYLNVPKKGFGKITFMDAFYRFGGKDKIVGFEASWNNITGIKDNYIAYRKAFQKLLQENPLIDISVARQKAAFETATGKWMNELGCVKVEVTDNDIEIIAIFKF